MNVNIETKEKNCEILRVGNRALEPHAKGGAFAVQRLSEAQAAASPALAARKKCIREALTSAMHKLLETDFVDLEDDHWFRIGWTARRVSTGYSMVMASMSLSVGL